MSDEALTLLVVASDRVLRIFYRESHRRGLSRQQALVLVALWHRPLPLSALRDDLGIRPASLRRSLTALSDRALVRMTKRASQIRLTDHGVNLLNELGQSVNDRVQFALAATVAGDRQRASSAVESILKLLKTSASRGSV